MLYLRCVFCLGLLIYEGPFFYYRRKNMSGKRISMQNYCVSCIYRKRIHKKAICISYLVPINQAMSYCRRLQPFRDYETFKNQKED